MQQAIAAWKAQAELHVQEHADLKRSLENNLVAFAKAREENEALSQQLNNKDIALNEFTTKLTDFRNGDTNMHVLHVNKEKGRSCKACHEVHAGMQDKHVRKEVPFGKAWKLPVNFTKTPTGGRCVVGCHKPKEYDRTNPVVY